MGLLEMRKKSIFSDCCVSDGLMLSLIPYLALGLFLYRFAIDLLVQRAPQVSIKLRLSLNKLLMSIVSYTVCLQALKSGLGALGSFIEMGL